MDIRPEPYPYQREPENKAASAVGTVIGLAYWLPIVLFITLFAGAVVLNLILIPFR